MKAQILVNALLKLFPVVLFFSSGFSHVTGDPVSISIFTKMHWEPVGRYIIGALELAVGFLMILPGRSLEAGIVGTLMGLGMVGAHAMVLGTDLDGDGGWRFSLALVLLASCMGLVIVHRKEIPDLPRRLAALRKTKIKMP